MSDWGEVRDLAALIASRRLETEQAITLIIACCKALDGADLIGGVTPSRFMLSTNGDVTIGAPIPSPDELAYAAPEFGDAPATVFRVENPRVVGRPVSSPALIFPSPDFEIDRPRTAVFSLGCILWELLAGRRPFVGNTDYETLLLTRAAQVPPLPGATPKLEAIVRTAMAKDVESRYQTPLQFAEALAGYLVAGR